MRDREIQSALKYFNVNKQAKQKEKLYDHFNSPLLFIRNEIITRCYMLDALRNNTSVTQQLTSISLTGTKLSNALLT